MLEQLKSFFLQEGFKRIIVTQSSGRVFVTGQKYTFVGDVLDQGMLHVTVGGQCSHHHHAMLVRELCRLA